MPRALSVSIFIIFILWLSYRDRQLRPMPSSALWVPLLWLLIIASRPVSFWFGGSYATIVMERYLEGSPMDRNVYIVLLLLGFVTLYRRDIHWSDVYGRNRWIVFLFAYWLLSLVWADYAFVGFKRWFKDVGNVVMVLVVLTDRKPIAAIRALLSRCTNLLVPLSVMFIKYYPELGRYYDTTTWQHLYRGVAIEKNSLGVLCFCCGMFLVWDFLEMRAAPEKWTDTADTVCRAALAGMVVWLLLKANSVTSSLALLLVAGILLYMQLPSARHKIRHLGTFSLLLTVAVIILYSLPEIVESLLNMMGRSMTLTGRTELWEQVLKVPINPLIGTGYQNFWLGNRAEQLWSLWNFRPNQAHNGYLETYLNGGLVGLMFLTSIIIAGAVKIRNTLLRFGMRNIDILRFGILSATVFYNWTEGYFNRMSPIWFVFLLSTVSLRSQRFEDASSMKGE